MLTKDAEVTERLERIARHIGARVFGVEIGVDGSGDRLVFVDADGDSLMNDGQEIIAATAKEIENDTFLEDFFVRALRAAGIAKYQEIERSRTP